MSEPLTFAKYLIEKKLGQGGMGTVYLAIDHSLNRKVAIKVISSDNLDMIERFHLESQAVARLKHPNIVQVHEANSEGTQHYFVMDYIEGLPLEELIELHPDHKQAADIIRQIALALDYAHNQNIIHRDIKPSNILVDKSGKAYLTDFGIAKQLTGLDKKLTLTGTTIGTPDYMSPEQAMGQKDLIDGRTDIFSLGATLYQALTGKPPFEGDETYEIFDKIINKEPSPPGTVIRNIPRDLETICLKCLNKDLAKRYQTAKELADDLERFLDDRPILARRISLLGRLWRIARKNKAAAIGITGALMALAAFGVWMLISAAQADRKSADYRNQAYALFEKGDFEEALTACEMSLSLSIYNPDTDQLRDKCLARIKDKQLHAQSAREQLRRHNEAKVILDRASFAGNADQKIRIALQALEIDPEFGDAYQILGYAYKDKKDFKQAFDYFTKATIASPSLAYAYYERAMITAYVYNKPEEAIADFEKVVKYDQNSHIGWFAKADISYIRGQFDAAIADYNKALEFDPNFSMAYNNRGTSYLKKRELDKATEDFKRALQCNPNLIDAHNNLGSVYFRQGKYELAIMMLDNAIKLYPNYERAYARRGLCYLKLGNLAEAADNFQTALRIEPNLPEAHNGIGQVYRKQANYSQAIAEFSTALRVSPANTAYLRDRGEAYAANNQLELALADYAEILRLEPNGELAEPARKTIAEWKARLAETPNHTPKDK